VVTSIFRYATPSLQVQLQTYSTNILFCVYFLHRKGKTHLLVLANFYAARCVRATVHIAKLKIYVAKDDLFVADSMEDAICNQANLLASSVVRGVPRVENQTFVNYRPSFGY